MGRIAIVTDSNSGITQAQAEQLILMKKCILKV